MKQLVLIFLTCFIIGCGGIATVTKDEFCKFKKGDILKHKLNGVKVLVVEQKKYMDTIIYTTRLVNEEGEFRTREFFEQELEK